MLERAKTTIGVSNSGSGSAVVVSVSLICAGYITYALIMYIFSVLLLFLTIGAAASSQSHEVRCGGSKLLIVSRPNF